MNGMSISTGVTLVSSVLSLEFLSQCGASPVSSLSSVNTPLTQVSPTIEALDDLDSGNPTKLTDVPDSKIASYTQKQLECAERLGISPLACNEEGQLIRQKKNLDDGYFVQKIKRQENTNETVPAESEYSWDRRSTDIVLAVVGTVVFVVVIGVSIAIISALVYSDRKLHSSVQDSDTDLTEIIPEEGLSSEALIEKVELGTLDGCSIVGLKNKETGVTLLHELGLKEPQRIEKWVDEGKLEVGRDLGNKKEDHVDNFGNSVLHVIAFHYPHIIDKWVRSDKIAIDELDRIKNDKDQSVWLYVKEVNPEIYSAFQK